MHIYTLKQNAVRAARKAGLDADAVQPAGGGFAVVPPEAPKRRREPATAPRPGSKNERLLAMLTREGGATAAQLEAALGWKGPSVRCAVQRVTRRYGLTWRHVPGQDGAKSRWEASATS